MFSLSLSIADFFEDFRESAASRQHESPGGSEQPIADGEKKGARERKFINFNY